MLAGSVDTFVRANEYDWVKTAFAVFSTFLNPILSREANFVMRIKPLLVIKIRITFR